MGHVAFTAFISSAGANPNIDFGELKLPQSAYAVGGQVSVIDPAINRVAGDAEVLGHLFDGVPALVYHRSCHAPFDLELWHIVKEDRT